MVSFVDANHYVHAVGGVYPRSVLYENETRAPFRDLLAADPDVSSRLSPAELDQCFDPAWYVRHVDAIFRRAGLA